MCKICDLAESVSRERSTVRVCIIIAMSPFTWKISAYSGPVICTFALLGIILFGCHYYTVRKEYPQWSAGRLIVRQCKLDILFIVALAFLAYLIFSMEK